MAQHGRRPEDRYTNLASAAVTETAVGTLTYVELLTGISLGQGTGMLIDQIDYMFGSGVLEDIIADGDELNAGWFTSNSPSLFSLTDRRLIHQVRLSQTLVGAVVSQSHHKQPFVSQFFPPMIIAAPRLYLGIQSASIAAVANVVSRIFFRYIDLTDKEYLELAETFILVG